MQFQKRCLRFVQSCEIVPRLSWLFWFEKTFAFSSRYPKICSLLYILKDFHCPKSCRFFHSNEEILLWCAPLSTAWLFVLLSFCFSINWRIDLYPILERLENLMSKAKGRLYQIVGHVAFSENLNFTSLFFFDLVHLISNTCWCLQLCNIRKKNLFVVSELVMKYLATLCRGSDTRIISSQGQRYGFFTIYAIL